MSVVISRSIPFASFHLPVSFCDQAFFLHVAGVCCHQCMRSHNSFHYLFLVSRILLNFFTRLSFFVCTINRYHCDVLQYHSNVARCVVRAHALSSLPLSISLDSLSGYASWQGEKAPIKRCTQKNIANIANNIIQKLFKSSIRSVARARAQHCQPADRYRQVS